MNFDIQPQAPTPIYRQIVDQVTRRVAAGQLRAGDELPSVRAMAALHAINPMTVSKAYALLETQGLVQRLRGQGMVIADTSTTHTKTQRLALLKPSLQAAARHARELGIPLEDVLQALKKTYQGDLE